MAKFKSQNAEHSQMTIKKGNKVIVRKGYTSSSNPENKKFREQASAKLFGKPQSQAIDASRPLNWLSSAEDEDNMSDTQSLGGLSTISAHTNVTFDNLLHKCSSESKIHQSLAETFSNVVDLIQKKGGKESNAEYYAAFLHLLDLVEAPAKVESILILLYHILPKMSSALLRGTFARVCKKLVGYLETYGNSEYGHLVRNALLILGHYLRVQELEVWQLANSKTHNISLLLLNFCTHVKPNTRKAAQEAITSLIRSSDIMLEPNAPQHHPFIHEVIRYCDSFISAKNGAQVDQLHAMGLLEKVLPCLGPSLLQPCCEGLLGAMVAGDKLVAIKCLRVLNSLFNSESRLSPELNAKLINALYDHQPAVSNEDLMICWLTTQTSSLMCLYKLDEDLVLRHLNKFFDVATKCWASGPYYGVHADVVTFLQKLVNSILLPLHSRDDPKVATSIEKLFTATRLSLRQECKLARPCVLKMLGNLVEAFGSKCPQITADSLESLKEMADHGTEFQGEVDAVVAKALIVLGPRCVLKHFPLEMFYDGNKKEFNFPRAWMLPLLKNYVRKSELQVFYEKIAPLTNSIQVKMDLAKSQDHMSHYKIFETLYFQLWAIFPAFCHSPSDVCQVFPKLVPTIGPVLQEGQDLRTYIMAGLRHLVNHCLQPSGQEAKNTVASYIPKFAPVLFNCYIKQEEQSNIRTSAFETVKLLLAIGKQEDLQTFYGTVSKRLANCRPDDKFTKYALLDLVQIFLPYLTEPQLLDLENLYVPLIKTTEEGKVTAQKKGYRLLEELVRCPSPVCQAVVKQKLADLQNLYLDGLHTALPSSKASRLRTLVCLLNLQDSPAHDFVKKTLPEAMLSVRECSARARQSGYAAVVATGQAFLRWWPDVPPHENLDKLAMLLLPGFGGDSYQIATTILCCAKFLAEFRKKVAEATLQSMVSAATTLLQSESNEVVHACLTFLRVVLSCFTSLELQNCLPLIINGLASISTQRMRRFRFKAKEILVKLIRMFGMDQVAPLVPETHKKVLANIRKTEARKARRRAGLIDDSATQAGDEDDESATISQSWDDNNTKYTSLSMHSFEDIIGNLSLDDDERMTRKSARTIKRAARRNAPKVYLKDGLDVNLADPSIMSNILTSRPGMGRPAPVPRPQAKEMFRINKEGKLVIVDSDDEEEVPESRKRKREEGSMRSIMTKSNKKWAMDYDDDISEDGDFSDIAETYKSRSSRKSNKSRVSSIGQKYRSKKGPGDCQKKHALEPHEYIPLERSRKGKVKCSKLKSIFAGAAKGAKKGVSLKRKQRSKKAN